MFILYVLLWWLCLENILPQFWRNGVKGEKTLLVSELNVNGKSSTKVRVVRRPVTVIKLFFS